MATNFGNDYFNACCTNSVFSVPLNIGGDNYQYARTGNGYIAEYVINSPPFNNSRLYYQTKLKDSLKAGKKYYAEYYVNLIDTYLKGCNNIAMLFTNNPIYVDTNSATYPALLQANPQIIGYGNPIVTDTMNWVKISGIFTAQGGEQYLTLGNFKLASQTQFKQIAPFGTGYNGAAYYVDDVAVYNLDSMCLKADAGRDTTITIGDSIFIGSYTNGLDSILWFNASGQVIDSVQPGFWVKPNSNIFYVLHQVVNGCFSSDTVYINVVLPLRFIRYALRQAQGDKVENLWLTANEINVSHFNIQRSINGKDFITIGTQKAQNKSYNEYSFTDVHLHSLEGLGVGLFYRIQSIDKDGKTNYTEIKRININDKQETSNVVIFPNPTKGLVHISIPREEKGVWNIKVQDIMGRMLQTKTTSAITKTMDLVVSNQTGLYYITLENKTTNKKIVEKVVVE